MAVFFRHSDVTVQSWCLRASFPARTGGYTSTKPVRAPTVGEGRLGAVVAAVSTARSKTTLTNPELLHSDLVSVKGVEMPASIAGTMAPRFALENVVSGERTAPNYDRWTLIAFYKVACPTCQLAMPYVEAYTTYALGGLEVFAVVEDPPEEARTFRKAFGSTVVTASDPPPYSVSAAFGLTNVPTMFLLEPGGRIARTQVGFSKVAYNEIAVEIGHRLGMPPVEVCPADDGAPAVKPG